MVGFISNTTSTALVGYLFSSFGRVLDFKSRDPRFNSLVVNCLFLQYPLFLVTADRRANSNERHAKNLHKFVRLYPMLFHWKILFNHIVLDSWQLKFFFHFHFFIFISFRSLILRVFSTSQIFAGSYMYAFCYVISPAVSSGTWHPDTAQKHSTPPKKHRPVYKFNLASVCARESTCVCTGSTSEREKLKWPAGGSWRFFSFWAVSGMGVRAWG